MIIGRKIAMILPHCFLSPVISKIKTRTSTRQKTRKLLNFQQFLLKNILLKVKVMSTYLCQALPLPCCIGRMLLTMKKRVIMAVRAVIIWLCLMYGLVCAVFDWLQWEAFIYFLLKKTCLAKSNLISRCCNSGGLWF